MHADILDQKESLRKPFTGAFLLHAAVIGGLAGYAWIGAHRDSFGDPNAAWNWLDVPAAGTAGAPGTSGLPGIGGGVPGARLPGASTLPGLGGGTGTGDMIRRCQNAGLAEPEFALSDGFVTTLRRKPERA